MEPDKGLLTLDVQDGHLTLTAAGAWTGERGGELDELTRLAFIDASPPQAVDIDLRGVERLDMLGAWLLERLLRRCHAGGGKVQFIGLPQRYRGLLGQLQDVNRRVPGPRPKTHRLLAALEAFGRMGVAIKDALLAFLSMLGMLGAAVARVLRHPKELRLTSVVHHLYRVGWEAVPIMLLITFLIGGIIAQQGIFHFRKFGADAYVVDMVGILVLREIGVLIVSIMVAGRSGSAYTAELGSMKMREEIDALRTMGFNPIDVLVLPRVIALLCALPVLAFLGSMAALYGGGLVAWLYGGMSPAIFIARLREAISITHFEVGMIKAPFMALAIGMVACSEGLRVKGSAESLGLQTTTSVVKSIFLVIVLDGVFAVFFASIGM
ncbi:MAG TPA: MlaE family lipid ABC transporter permease subunit [Xanthobacteraceae bacterium]|nr:MlaE family lipid ABC transporter permease subunit [Xanthobacteraceae bacterium]